MIHLQESVAIVIHYYLSYPFCFLYDCAESVSWVITTAKRLIKSAYSYRIKYYRSMYRPILDTIDRYMDQYVDRYIHQYTRYSIVTLSVKRR